MLLCFGDVHMLQVNTLFRFHKHTASYEFFDIHNNYNDGNFPYYSYIIAGKMSILS